MRGGMFALGDRRRRGRRFAQREKSVWSGHGQSFRCAMTLRYTDSVLCCSSLERFRGVEYKVHLVLCIVSTVLLEPTVSTVSFHLHLWSTIATHPALSSRQRARSVILIMEGFAAPATSRGNTGRMPPTDPYPSSTNTQFLDAAITDPESLFVAPTAEQAQLASTFSHLGKTQAQWDDSQVTHHYRIARARLLSQALAQSPLALDSYFHCSPQDRTYIGQLATRLAADGVSMHSRSVTGLWNDVQEAEEILNELIIHDSTLGSEFDSEVAQASSASAHWDQSACLAVLWERREARRARAAAAAAAEGISADKVTEGSGSHATGSESQRVIRSTEDTDAAEMTRFRTACPRGTRSSRLSGILARIRGGMRGSRG